MATAIALQPRTDPVTGPVTGPVAGPRTAVVDGVRVELGGEAGVGTPSDLHFEFSDAVTGRSIDDLQPYLAAAGHVVIMRTDGRSFAHEHAEVFDERGRPVFATPGRVFGPRLDVHARFDFAGTYRLWGQFRLADGRVITVPFTVEVFAVATWGCSLIYGLRTVVQSFFYRGDQPELLALSKLILGWPLTVVAVVLTLAAVRRAAAPFQPSQSPDRCQDGSARGTAATVWW